MADDKKIPDSHCISCHQDHEQGYAPYDEFEPYCCCEQERLHEEPQ